MKRTILKLVSKPLQLVNALVIAGSAIWFAFALPSLGDRIPVHWGPSGPNRWGNPNELWLFLGVLLMNTAIMWAAFYFVVRGKPRDLSEVSEARRLAAAPVLEDQLRLGVQIFEQMFILMNLGFAGFWVVTVQAGRSVNVDLINRGVLWLFLLITVAILGPMTRGLLRGMRNRRILRDLLPPSDEDRWIAGGAFYYAPEDPRFWVAKRIGYGWTMNMAKPGAFWLLGALVVLPLLTVIVFLSWMT